MPVPTTTTPATHRERAEARQWASFRDEVGLAIDTFLSTKPSDDMRRIVLQIEDALARGDRASKLT